MGKFAKELEAKAERASARVLRAEKQEQIDKLRTELVGKSGVDRMRIIARIRTLEAEQAALPLRAAPVRGGRR